MGPDELQPRFEDRKFFEQHLERMIRQAVVEEMQGPLPDRFHGRWNMLSVSDIRFLIAVGIEID